MRIVDLSQGWWTGMPTFGADWYPNFEMSRVMTPSSDPARVDRTFSQYTIFPHNATHVESSLHFFPDGEELDAVAIATFVGWACVADLSSKTDLEPVSGEDLDLALDGRWQMGDRLLIRTDHPQRHLGQDDYWDTAPFVTPSAADWIIENGAALVGLDCLTERPGDPSFPIHRRLLSAGVPILENMANLHDLSQSECLLFAAPIKIADVEAAPVRAIALEGVSRTDVM